VTLASAGDSLNPQLLGEAALSEKRSERGISAHSLNDSMPQPLRERQMLTGEPDFFSPSRSETISIFAYHPSHSYLNEICPLLLCIATASARHHCFEAANLYRADLNI
jgi:hypothetical protein